MHKVDFLDSESLARLLELEPVENFIVTSQPARQDQVTSNCTSMWCCRHITQVSVTESMLQSSLNSLLSRAQVTVEKQSDTPTCIASMISVYKAGLRKRCAL
ncbi:hypothetical protein KGM_208809 [Danaus plexippus plexippus]|uniref:Uncharacterized protein n=1 Tax=Danaus plexippus plexippus TaxID=278856 RepID=A0A212EMG0_DANPL|nr:hypothetical protein KGM_208809 [Danaus plexippus plexippus]